jgi:hypothetical protein
VPDVLVQDMVNPSRTWIVNLLDKANVTLYTRVMAACVRLLSMEGPLFNSIVDLAQIPLEDGFVAHDEEETRDLNHGQKLAVGAALRNHLTLIQGMM